VRPRFKLIKFKVEILFLLLQVLLHAIFLKGIGLCVALSPDETTYLKIFGNFLNSQKLNTAQIVIGSNDYVYVFYFYIAEKFHRFGIEELTSLRITSILFFTISQLISFFLFSANARLNSIKFKLLIYSIYTFAPTVFIFSSLGMRESLLILSLSLIFLSINFLEKGKFFWGSINLLIGLSILSGLKIYLFFVVIFTLLIFMILNKYSYKKFLLISFVSLAIPLSLNASNVKQTFTSLDVNFDAVGNSSSAPTAEEGSSEKINGSDNLASVTLIEISKCKNNESFGFLGKIFDSWTPSSTVVNPAKNTYAGDFVVSEDFRGILPPKFYVSNFFDFLFNPLFHLNNVSRYFLLELPIWIFLYFQVFNYINFQRKGRLKFDGLSVFALLFTLLFVLYSVLTEVNVGTAIRHRILLILPLMLVFSRLNPGAKFRRGKEHQ